MPFESRNKRTKKMCAKVNAAAEYGRDLLVSFSWSRSPILFMNCIGIFRLCRRALRYDSVDIPLPISSFSPRPAPPSLRSMHERATAHFHFDLFLSMRVLFTDECTTLHCISYSLLYVLCIISSVSARCVSIMNRRRRWEQKNNVISGLAQCCSPVSSTLEAYACVCVLYVRTLDASVTDEKRALNG